VGTVYRPGDVPNAQDALPSGLALGDSRFWLGSQTLLHALVDHPRTMPAHTGIRQFGIVG
jgi:hypothetical protein